MPSDRLETRLLIEFVKQCHINAKREKEAAYDLTDRTDALPDQYHHWEGQETAFTRLLTTLEGK